MSHEEYGQGFVDGFNAALKSDYIKELYQTRDKEQLLMRIKELEAQVEQIRSACLATYGMCQSVYSPQYQQTMNLANMVNIYPLNRSF